jgi:hypothetical protein
VVNTWGSITLVLPAPREIVGFSDIDVVEGIAAAQAAIAMLQAAQVRMIGRLNQLRGGDRSVADEIAPELGMSRHTAQRRVGLSDDLLTRLPRTLAAMDRGDLDLYKAEKIADVTAALPDEKCRGVDAAIAGKVAGKDPAQIRRAARDLVHRIDGGGANERATKRREDRRIELCHDEDAMATLLAYLPAETASASYARVDTIARALKTPGEDRTLEQYASRSSRTAWHAVVSGVPRKLGAASSLRGWDVEDELGPRPGDLGWVWRHDSDLSRADSLVELDGGRVGDDAHGGHASGRGLSEHVGHERGADAESLCGVGDEQQIQFRWLWDQAVEADDRVVGCRDEGGVPVEVGGGHPVSVQDRCVFTLVSLGFVHQRGEGVNLVRACLTDADCAHSEQRRRRSATVSRWIRAGGETSSSTHEYVQCPSQDSRQATVSSLTPSKPD